MPVLPVTLIKGDSHGIETDYRDNLPVNMYAVNRKILDVNGYLRSYPGLSSFGIGLGVDRGANYNERLNDQYRVSGEKLISISAAGIVVELGDISGSDQAAMPYSFNTQAIIADYRMWLYNGAVFSEITDVDLGNPIDGVWINGYYFLTDGEYIYHTEITNEKSIDPLKFATAEFMPDKSLGLLKTQDNKVAVFGRYSTEYFVDVAQANFAFTRIESRSLKVGIVATHAKCELGGSFYLTGGHKENDVGVYKIEASQSKKISTREVDKIIKQYSEAELVDMRMECRQEDDIIFVLVHLPNETLCFNETVAASIGISFAWSVLKTDVLTNLTYRGINGVFDPRLAKWVYGDKRDSTIGILDNSVSTHYGEMIEWILYTPFINLETFSVDKIEIETIPGFTTAVSASVALSLTYDGVIYGQEFWLDYGEPSKYNTRFIVRRLGYINNWAGFKLRGVSESKMAFSLMKLIYS